MKRLPVLVPILVAACLILPVGVVSGQQPPAPVPVLEKRFPATAPPGPYNLLLLVLDLAPGAEFAPHTHGGPVFVSVVEGTFWERSGGRETVLNVGDTLMEETGRMHAAGNNGPGTARLLVTVLLPQGAELSTDTQMGGPQPVPAGVTVAGQAVLENPQAPAPMDVVQRVTDLPAGALVAPHTHPGPNFNLLLQGQLVLDMHGMAHTYQAGDNWVEPADVVHDGRNPGATTARIMGSALVPRGAPVAIPAQQPAAPAAQPKPGAPAPKPGPPAAPPAAQPKPAAPAQAPKPVAAPAAAPAQAPRALPRTGDAENWAIGGLAVAGLVLLGAGVAARRRSF